MIGVRLQVALGRYLESLAKRRSMSALSSLKRLIPTTVHLVSGNSVHDTDMLSTETVTLSQVKAGDIIKVMAGERFPTDGAVHRIASGHASTLVDQSVMTGESLLVKKAVNDLVFAGTLNQGVTISIRASRVGASTSLGQIVEAVQQVRYYRIISQVDPHG